MQHSPQKLFLLGAAILCLGLVSCATQPQPKEGSHEYFTQLEEYPKTSLYWKNKPLYEITNSDNSYIVIDLETQRGFLMSGDRVVIDYPICSGTKTHPTPKGLFKITEKKEKKSSNRYGRIYDAEDNLVNGDADIRKDEVPEGGKFVGAPMPYWMRLTNDGIGHHVGPTHRRPSSHGCIRGPRKVIPYVFAKVDKGTQVIID